MTDYAFYSHISCDLLHLQIIRCRSQQLETPALGDHSDMDQLMMYFICWTISQTVCRPDFPGESIPLPELSRLWPPQARLYFFILRHHHPTPFAFSQALFVDLVPRLGTEPPGTLKSADSESHPWTARDFPSLDG